MNFETSSIGTERSTIHCPPDRRRSCDETGLIPSATHAPLSSLNMRWRLPKSLPPLPFACWAA